MPRRSIERPGEFVDGNGGGPILDALNDCRIVMSRLNPGTPKISARARHVEIDSARRHLQELRLRLPRRLEEDPQSKDPRYTSALTSNR